MWHYYKFSDEHTETARQHLTRMTREAPGFADTYTLLAMIDCRRITFCEPDDPEDVLRSAIQHATKAVSLDERNSLARVAMSRVLMFQGKYEHAVDQAELAIAINPSSTVAHLCLALALYWGGRADEAVPIIDTSVRLSPKGPYREFKLLCKAFCFHALGNLGEAEALARQVLHGHLVGPIGLMFHAAVLARLGRQEEAKANIAELIEAWPKLRLNQLQRCWQTLVPVYLNPLVQDLRSAGLSD